MNIAFENSGSGARRFRTGVSLHSHTLHSRETLAFAYRLASRSHLVRTVVADLERRFQAAFGASLDLKRGWWTPPLSAHSAWLLEKQNIQSHHGLSALVSLSDHDNIEAPMSLSVLSECRRVPISVEWSVPFENTFFHLGVHNLPADIARETMARFAAYTREPARAALDAIFDCLHHSTQTLVVFNHPCWDEGGIGRDAHHAAVIAFTRRYRTYLHAVEINGLRPWSENQRALELAGIIDRPVISGGDRHGFEANTVLNLTNALDFDEFVDEIRSGESNILITAQYREPFAMRVIQNIEEMCRDLDDHDRGWRRWSDRVFYEFDDGTVRSLRDLFGNQVPRRLEAVFRAVQLFRSPHMRRAVRLALLGGHQPSLM